MKFSSKKLTPKERIDWIRLARTHNVGSSTFVRLFKVFDEDISLAVDSLPDFIRRGGLSKKVTVCEESVIEEEFEKCRKFGAEILTLLDDDYPRLAREIYDPAPVLTIKGDKKLLNKDSIAIVGPRNASFHACKFAQNIAQDLQKGKVVVVSGLARGIDAAAHRGSIDFGTVAVIAGGIESVYPSENRELYKQIKEKGVLVTEHPFGAKTKAPNFIQRNRIISAMSYGVVVIEAGKQSGSLATARFALDQGREVFAVPGFPADPRTHGSNILIGEGAVFTTDSECILEEIPRLRRFFGELGKLREPGGVEFEGVVSKFPSDEDIDKVRGEIEGRVGTVPIAIEEIIDTIQAPARLVNIAVVQLELAQKVEVNYGKIVVV